MEMTYGDKDGFRYIPFLTEWLLDKEHSARRCLLVDIALEVELVLIHG